MLPLALITSALLLLSSLSLQTLALQARQRSQQQWQLVQRRDALLSAGMHFLQRSRRHGSCLLAWPSERWQALPLCAEADRLALQSSAVPGLRWRLLHWQPGLPLANLKLQLPEQETAGSIALRLLSDGGWVLEAVALEAVALEAVSRAGVPS